MTLPADWKNCYFVLYKTNKDGTIDSTYVKPITKAQRATGEVLDFYGVKASKYGINVHPSTKYWGIFSIVNGNPKLLVSGDLIPPKTKQIVELSDGRHILLRRGARNLSMSISTTIASFKKKTA